MVEFLRRELQTRRGWIELLWTAVALAGSGVLAVVLTVWAIILFGA